MFRLLSGLNRQDVLHELKLSGISNPDARLINSLQHNFVVKVSGYNFNQLSELKEACRDTVSFEIIPSLAEDAITAYFIAFNNSILNLEQKTFQSFAGVNPQFQEELRTLLDNLAREEWKYSIRGGYLCIDRPLIMGILNITPDSFSDGGAFFSDENAYQRAMNMLAEGANLLDIGGESSRPGADPVSVEEEWSRIGPTLQRLTKTNDLIISVDTYKSEIARRALQEGAHIINDISGMGMDAQMATVVAEHNAPVILMHMQGKPKTMQKNPSYQNLMEEIFVRLKENCEYANDHGVQQIIVDTGIGFGKRGDDNFEILRRLREIRALGYPVLLGASRKSFIGKILDVPTDQRLISSVTAALYGIVQGANILRVHDVQATKEALTIYQAIRENKADW